MKLSLSITLFDGEELLEPKLRILRSEIDHVSIVYQQISYSYNNCSSNLLPELDRLMKIGLVDEISEFVMPAIKEKNFSPQKYEAKKRTIGLELAREFGASHFISLDADEFFLPEQFIYAKNQIIKNDYDATFCLLKDYWMSPENQINGIGEAWGEYLYVPLIYKIKENQKFTSKDIAWYFVICDTTRKLPTENPHKFEEKEILMHHMTNIRATRWGLISKFENRSSDLPPTIPSENMADILLAWRQNKIRIILKMSEVSDVFNIKSFFKERNFVEDKPVSSVLIKYWHNNGHSSLKGEQKLKDDLNLAVNEFKLFLKFLKNGEKKKALQLVDINYELYQELSDWLDDKEAEIAISEISFNFCVVTTQDNKLNSTLVFTWVPSRDKKTWSTNSFDQKHGSTNVPLTYKLQEAALAAVKDNNKWQISSFQELW